MKSKLLQLLAATALFAATVAGPEALGQTENGSPAKKVTPGSSLEEAAIQSRIALYSNTTKGQIHSEDTQQFQAVAKRLIAALSAGDSKGPQVPISVPFFLEDERILDRAKVTERLGEIVFPGVFAMAGNKQIVILDTLEQMEYLLEQRVPPEAREQWANHVAPPSRIALISGGPMLVGLSLRNVEGECTVSGLLFAFFPKPDSRIQKAVHGGLLDRK